MLLNRILMQNKRHQSHHVEVLMLMLMMMIMMTWIWTRTRRFKKDFVSGPVWRENVVVQPPIR